MWHVRACAVTSTGHALSPLLACCWHFGGVGSYQSPLESGSFRGRVILILILFFILILILILILIAMYRHLDPARSMHQRCERSGPGVEKEKAAEIFFFVCVCVWWWWAGCGRGIEQAPRARARQRERETDREREREREGALAQARLARGAARRRHLQRGERGFLKMANGRRVPSRRVSTARGLKVASSRGHPRGSRGFASGAWACRRCPRSMQSCPSPHRPAASA